MKLALGSDLHLEFGDCFFENEQNAEVLLLSGDILIAQELHDFKEPINDLIKLGRKQEAVVRYRDFLKRCSQSFKHVIYVAGNHEFYHGKWPLGNTYLKEECANYPNIYFLDNETKVINDIVFIGSTIWTDMNKHDPLTLRAVGGMLNDYNVIRNSNEDYRKLQPIDIYKEHNKSLKYIDSVIKDGNKYVVVGHHAPCKLSTKPQYAKDHLVNGGYSSDLTNFIYAHPQIVLWTHGHTHDVYDYMVGSTRVVCNPRGYVGYEVQDEHFKFMYLDV